MQNRNLYIGVSAAVIALVVTALGSGVFGYAGFGPLQWPYRLFEAFCHQDPARSFAIDGEPMAVCSRCFGIYSCFAAGWFLLPLISRAGVSGNHLLYAAKTAAGVAVLLNVVDILGNFTGFWQNTLYSRWAFGGFLGLSVVILFANEFTSLKIQPTGDVDGIFRTTDTTAG